jgi:hypothetical protein
VLYSAILSDPERVGHGREGFYFGENGEYTVVDAAKAIGEALYALGKVKTPEPSEYTEADLKKYFGVCDICLPYHLIFTFAAS